MLRQRTILIALFALLLAGWSLAPLFTQPAVKAQAGPRSQEQKKKRNPNANGTPEEEQKKEEQKVDKTAPVSAINISTDIVNVEAVVWNKKTGGIIQGLKKEDFEIYEDGIKQEVENFATPEAPVTMVLLLEYSKLIDVLGNPAGGGMEYGRIEILRPAYEFVSRFVQPKDFISIVAFDIRPTPIVDFTDDKKKLMGAIQLLIRNNPAFSESNFFDSIKFVLRGGKGDAVVLNDGDKQETDKQGNAEYAGLYEVNARTAVLYIGSGLDTFSKINFDEARKIVENSGIPFYAIGTGNLFLKLYDQQLDPGRGTNINGIPFDRMSMLQAQNTLKTFSSATGGEYLPMTFAGEIPSLLQSISAKVRNQYSLGYTPSNTRKEGKRRKIVVKVNLGDKIDPKLIAIQHRQTYVEAKKKK